MRAAPYSTSHDELFGSAAVELVGNEELAELCTRHYHLLRDHIFEHAEVRAILAAVD